MALLRFDVGAPRSKKVLRQRDIAKHQSLCDAHRFRMYRPIARWCRGISFFTQLLRNYCKY